MRTPLFDFFLLLLATTANALTGNEKSPYPYVTWEGVQAVKQRLTFVDDDNNSTDPIAESYRQNICHRYERVRRGEVKLRDALQGLELRPLMRVGKFFQYTEEDGIDPLDPGLLALMMDELGRRAGFTWRDSFGVVFGLPVKPVDAPEEETVSFTDLLQWSVDTYDLSCNWWDQTLERLELGISFQTPWFDGSIIMVQKMEEAVVDDDNIQVWNWLRPFDTSVWIVTVATIIGSGLAYQWLEYLSGHRRGRTFWQWMSDNVYLSAIAFPQNYEFQPRSAGARMFGVSISIWALVMTATYTANLASLLVDHKATQVVVESIDDAITLDIPVCVYENTGADAYIKSKYRQARRVPFDSELKTFQGLHDGQCEINLAYYQNWLGFEAQKSFNPYCDLEWVGRTIKTIQSGFANSADVGIKCSSLIGTVLDIYLDELLASGFIEDMWEQHYDKSRDINCDAVNPIILANSQQAEDDRRRRMRRLTSPEDPTVPHFAATHHHQRHRKLKAGRAGGAAGGVAAVGEASVEVDASTMTLNQMAGTFILHWWVTSMAIVIGYISRWYKQRERRLKGEGGKSTNDASWDYTQWFFKQRGLFSSEQTKAARRGSDDDGNTGASSDEPRSSNNQNKVSVILEGEEEEMSSWNQAQEELQETREALRETKQELQDTRREMSEQMGMILQLLKDKQPNKNGGLGFY